MDDKQFLSRWSKRKMAARKADAMQQAERHPAPPDGAAHTHTVDPKPDLEREALLRENCKAAEAVDLATLNEHFDFSVFMKEGVPELLRKKAMAALWRSSPIFANLDGLVDHGEDYASPDMIQKSWTSGWQVGRGYLKEAAKTVEAAADVPDADDGAPPRTATVDQCGDPACEPKADNRSLPPENSTTDDAASITAPEMTPKGETVAEPRPHISLRRRLILDAES